MANRNRSRVGRRDKDYLHGRALTQKQLLVIYHTALGKDRDQVARALHITPHTLNVHIARIYGKTGLHNAQQLTIFAVLARLVTRHDLLDALPDTHLPDLPQLGGDL
jgi:DNA-binding NarL/FixJ family response regulator